VLACVVCAPLPLDEWHALAPHEARGACAAGCKAHVWAQEAIFHVWAQEAIFHVWAQEAIFEVGEGTAGGLCLAARSTVACPAGSGRAGCAGTSST